jgi:hypothetical protein
MAEGNVDVTVYVAVPLTGPDAVMQVYMYTGMPFPVKPGFFVNIESNFQYIAISKGDRKFRAMTLNNFLKCKRVGDSYFCKDGNVVRDVPNYSKPPKDTDPIEGELCLIALFKEKYEHARKHCLITFQRQTPQVKQVGPSTFAIYEAKPHQEDRACKEGPNQAPVVHRVTIRPNTLVTVPAGCIMVTSSFTFSPVATSFIRDRKDYLIDYDWPESYKSIIGELDTHALARMQNETGGQIPMDKFTLNTPINILRNVKNETITTRKIYDYGGISGMAIGIIVAGACIAFACYTCFTRTPSERTLRQSHPPAYEPPAPTTRNHPLITITSPPRRNTAVRTPSNTMVSDRGLFEEIRRTGRVREQQRILQQAGRNAEEQEHTPGH